MNILQKHKQLQFFKEKEVTKLPYRLRLTNMQFFSEEPGAGEPPVDPVEPPAGENPGGEPTEPQLDPATKDFIEKMMQSREDKLRTKYSKELNATKKELENYKTASMTAQEKAEYEMQELQKTLEEREQALLQKEMRGIALEGLASVNIDLEPKELAELADVVIGKDEEDTKRRLKVIEDKFSKAVGKAVDKKFKEAGRNIYAGSGNGATFTRQQVASMSQSDINANWEQIQKDMKTWTN
ncbi:DUF4355 domain-containing protein [Bacillus cereus]|uniref:capsid assembly scaffolding protein Gp46 family protein n=1 Tax=Bacillus cereus TaxID=1396 RepID=UPI0021111870|nr:DUF4355 domain-containing protein [Bacillus cereus]